MNIQYYFAVDNIAATHAQIEVAVMRGQRPDLSAITGPEAAVKHVKDCVSRCWDQSPDSRPSFAGRPIYLLHLRFYVSVMTYLTSTLLYEDVQSWSYE